MIKFSHLNLTVMKNNRKTYSSTFKAKVAMEAFSQLKTISEIAEEYELHPTQVSKWKKALEKNAGELFSDKRKQKDDSKEKKIDELYRKIGKLQVENDWMKKKVGFSP